MSLSCNHGDLSSDAQNSHTPLEEMETGSSQIAWPIWGTPCSVREILSERNQMGDSWRVILGVELVLYTHAPSYIWAHAQSHTKPNIPPHTYTKHKWRQRRGQMWCKQTTEQLRKSRGRGRVMASMQCWEWMAMESSACQINATLCQMNPWGIHVNRQCKWVWIWTLEEISFSMPGKRGLRAKLFPVYNCSHGWHNLGSSVKDSDMQIKNWTWLKPYISLGTAEEDLNVRKFSIKKKKEPVISKKIWLNLLNNTRWIEH